MSKTKFKIAVVSGKGGVGKSMFTSSLAMLFSLKKKIIVVDCDVDAPNLHLWLGQKEVWDKVEKISVSERPVIDFKKCTDCGRCVQICAFGAIKMIQKKPVVNKFFCEGCGACEVICPAKAIKMELVKNAEIRIKRDVYGFPLISAQLYPGETGSGKIVDQIKQTAEKFEYELMILDSPAGTGCPVIAALNGVDFAFLITEPTPSGFADLKRALTVVNHFKIPYGLVINKWDINPNESRKIQDWFGDNFLGKISYDQRIFQAIAQLKPILETNLPVKKETKKIYNSFLKKKIL
jgi:MinD superfamily P-loop ATPase